MKVTFPDSSYIKWMTWSAGSQFPLRIKFDSGAVYGYDVRPLGITWTTLQDPAKSPVRDERDLTPGEFFARRVRDKCPWTRLQDHERVPVALQ